MTSETLENPVPGPPSQRQPPEAGLSPPGGNDPLTRRQPAAGPRATAPDTGARGLRVQRFHTGRGWVIIHEQSGKDLGLRLRLRRHAEAAQDELAATGEDFTLTQDQLMSNQLQRRPEAVAVGAVLGRWTIRARHCCEDGEHYDPFTYAMNGRCTGPVSNGHPRRS